LRESLLVELLCSASSRWKICSRCDKALGESLGESLLRELLLGKSLGESLEELLPVSDLLRLSLVPTARERVERTFRSLIASMHWLYSTVLSGIISTIAAMLSTSFSVISLQECYVVEHAPGA
jgi:hypothetical protein